MGEIVKKTKVVPFINTGTKELPKWTQIKKSTTFTLSMNPQTKTYDFISSEIPQDELDSYKPTLAQSLAMYKGEDDYEAIFDMLYNRATGDKAHRDILIVFYKEKGTCSAITGDVYKAWKVDSLVSINQMDTTNENIDFDLALNDIENGAVMIQNKEPVFISGEWDKAEFTKESDSVEDSNGNENAENGNTNTESANGGSNTDNSSNAENPTTDESGIAPSNDSDGTNENTNENGGNETDPTAEPTDPSANTGDTETDNPVEPTEPAEQETNVDSGENGNTGDSGENAENEPTAEPAEPAEPTGN